VAGTNGNGAGNGSRSATDGIRVVLVSPHALSRLGMARLLESLEGVDVVAQTAATADGRKLTEEYIPDVLLVDGDLAVEDGMFAVQEIKRDLPSVRVLFLAERAAQMQVETALEAGVDGFTMKDISLAELEATITRVANGDTVLHPEVAAVVARRLAANGKERPNTLTPRQREILRLLASGLENKQIARKLGIGVHTVKTHVSRVLAKLGVASRTEAVVVALRDRLIS
jgi:two-component system, NarL family, response regulator LiaR